MRNPKSKKNNRNLARKFRAALARRETTTSGLNANKRIIRIPPVPYIISFTIHILFLIFWGRVIILHYPEIRGCEIEVELMEIEIKAPREIPVLPEADEVRFDPEIKSEQTDVVPDDVEIVMRDAAAVLPVLDNSVPSILKKIKPLNSHLVLPGLMQMRSPEGRKAALAQYGGSDQTEQAVMKALRWLKKHQNKDGSWGDSNQDFYPALTGLALLAFLAHGETPQSPEFGACVLKAIEKLSEYADPANCSIYSLEGNAYVKGGNGYGHAIVMYALSEAYTLTKIPQLREIMNMGIGKIVNGQNILGGFNYNFDNTPYSDGIPRTDLSLGGWCMQALKASSMAGCDIASLGKAMEKALECLKLNCRNKKGIFLYEVHYRDRDFSAYTMTAVGTLCLHLLEAGNTPEAEKGLSILKKRAFRCDWQGDNEELLWAIHRWYYETQAFFQGHAGTGSVWKKWNKKFTKQLIKNQKPDGHWNTPAAEYARKEQLKDMVFQGMNESLFQGIDGPVYATALCCMMLEVYYRYLPTFKLMANPKNSAVVNQEGKDLENDDKRGNIELVIEDIPKVKDDAFQEIEQLFDNAKPDEVIKEIERLLKTESSSLDSSQLFRLHLLLGQSFMFLAQKDVQTLKATPDKINEKNIRKVISIFTEAVNVFKRAQELSRKLNDLQSEETATEETYQSYLSTLQWHNYLNEFLLMREDEKTKESFEQSVTLYQAALNDLRNSSEDSVVSVKTGLAKTQEQLKYLIFLPGQWQVKETTHFKIFHHNNDVAQKVGEAAETSYTRILDELDINKSFRPWKKKCEIYIYRTRKELQQATGAKGWITTFVGPGLQYQTHQCQSLSRLLDTPSHELVHLIFNDILKINSRLPIWLYEGVAAWHDEEDRTRLLLDKLNSKDFFSLRSMIHIRDYYSLNPEQVGLFYGECASLVEFLLKSKGIKIFTRFCQDAATEALETAVRKNYSDSFKSLNNLELQWLKYLEERKKNNNFTEWTPSKTP